MNATQNIFDIASEIGIPNEFITNVRVFDKSALTFETKSGAKYDAKLTKTGKVKKGSVRPA